MSLTNDIRKETFINRVSKRVDETHCYGFDSLIQKPIYRMLRVRPIQRLLDLALSIDAFIYLNTEIAFYKWRRFFPSQVIEPRHPQGSQFQNIAKSQSCN